MISSVLEFELKYFPSRSDEVVREYLGWDFGTYLASQLIYDVERYLSWRGRK